MEIHQQIQQDQIDPLINASNQQKKFTPQQIDQRKKMPSQMCAQGRKLLENKQYLQASKSFSKGIMCFQFLLKENLINKQQIILLMKDSIIPSYSNLSLCHLKLGSYDSVITFATQVINQDSSNLKALYRRGKAHKHLKHYDQALQDYNKLKKLDPQNEADYNNLIRQIKQIKNKQKQNQRKLAKKLIENYFPDQLKENQTNQIQNQSFFTKIKKCCSMLMFWR